MALRACPECRCKTNYTCGQCRFTNDHCIEEGDSPYCGLSDRDISFSRRSCVNFEYDEEL